ncbi:Monooxygenase FAD-binding protein [Pleurostoma richardsiae]|uniref:Monooxygenase FAD-binding protein n=1 Tax=Pleurostoma richardsiae TaxID=41990 RepID=A0AA38RTL2_9PEZI|nr:Monooxygenase FAD-binding protein [Pleurostoma richardsiae]
MTSNGIHSQQSQFDVAIIGGGITGLSLAVGLLRRNVNFTVYEQASASRELGAGIGFTANAERAMKALDPRIHAHFKKIAVQNGDDFFRYVNGLSSGSRPGNGDDDEADVMFKIYLGERGFEGCRRSDFLAGLLELLPAESLRFGQRVESVNDDNGRVTLNFHNGSTAQADVVIGCDGIKSQLRQIMFGAGFPAEYTHKFAFRGLIPMDQARAALGERKTRTRIMYLGPDGHSLTFPVAEGKMLNVVTFVTDPGPWSGGLDEGKIVMPADRSEAIAAYEAFGPDVRTIISLLPQQLDKWAIFDTYDHPPPSYAKGRLCLVGDAAHAAAPHHGAGAGCGIEDALALAELLAKVAGEGVPAERSPRRVVDALAVYNDVRYERSQWLVQTSRQVGHMYEWQDPVVGRDAGRFGEEFAKRCHRIWDYDTEKMVAEAMELFEKRSERSD